MEIHRCRFADYTPKSINSIRFTPSTWNGRPYLAVGRADGDIEIWNCDAGFSLEKTIPGPDGINLESMVWAHQIELTEEDILLYDNKKERQNAMEQLKRTPPRLFTSGLNGAIIEWSLETLLPKRAVDSYGGAVWCMSVNKKQTTIAVGADDGHIRLFDITDGGLECVRSLDSVKGKVLSLCWSKDDKFIYGGSNDGCIRKWDPKSGRILSRMNVQRGKSEVPMVWSTIMLSDNTLVCGDSRGNMTFFDTKIDVAFQTINSHTADILCLEFDNINGTLYASGVDQKLVQLIDSKKWVITGYRRSHTHDVRSIAINQNTNLGYIVSGGVDGRITITETANFLVSPQIKMPIFPTQHGVLSTSVAGKLVLMRSENELKLWKMGASQPQYQEVIDRLENGSTIQPQTDASFILRMKLSTSSSLVCSAISPNGRWIVASDNSEIKLFRVLGDLDNPEEISVVKVDDFFTIPSNKSNYLENLAKFATSLQFTPDNKKLIIGTAELLVYIVEINEIKGNDEETSEEQSTFSFNVSMVNCHHRLPYDSDLLSSCSSGEANNNSIHLYTKNTTKGLKNPHTSLHRAFCTLNVLGVSADSKWLATADSSGCIVITDLDSLKVVTELPQLSKKNNVPVSMVFVHKSRILPFLVIGYSFQDIIVWDMDKNKIADWSVKNPSSSFPSFFLNANYKLHGLVSSPTESGIIYAWGTDYICRIDLNTPVVVNGLVLNIDERKKTQDMIVNQVKEEYLSNVKNSVLNSLIETSKDTLSGHNSQSSISGKIVKLKKKEYNLSKSLKSETLNRYLDLLFTNEESQNEKLDEQHDPKFSPKRKITEIETNSIHQAQIDTISHKILLESKHKIKSIAISRLFDAGVISEQNKFNFSYTKRYNPIMGLSFVGDNQLAVIERPWFDILSSLPQALFRKKYGM
ncbi:hypothetical protein BB559_001715 [Furculomyces boomerangus]|uniref:Uncharacterized protein n=1 Tax=Furculomyces boomerangus TaxID=61424 RepID=A0A2T9Z0U0_9FUNG|nr:hypothetical protein BB559_001715 [Furculomyces boomerangus]